MGAGVGTGCRPVPPQGHVTRQWVAQALYRCPSVCRYTGLSQEDPMAHTTPAVRQVHQRIDRLQRPMIRFLGEFCGIATVNPPGDHYQRCTRFLADKFKSMGLATRIVPPTLKEQLRLVPGSHAHPRPSVIARWDVGAKRTLLLTGHYDVVPATSGWKSDPFTLQVRAGGRKLIARGVTLARGTSPGLNEDNVPPTPAPARAKIGCSSTGRDRYAVATWCRLGGESDSLPGGVARPTYLIGICDWKSGNYGWPVRYMKSVCIPTRLR